MVQAGQLISWHHATFQDLMTEKSRMMSNSLSSGIVSGVAGGFGGEAGRWLLGQAVKQRCFFGEKSVWRWQSDSDDSRDIVW
jgi:hypothetical protein